MTQKYNVSLYFVHKRIITHNSSHRKVPLQIYSAQLYYTPIYLYNPYFIKHFLHHSYQLHVIKLRLDQIYPILKTTSTRYFLLEKFKGFSPYTCIFGHSLNYLQLCKTKCNPLVYCILDTSNLDYVSSKKK